MWDSIPEMKTQRYFRGISVISGMQSPEMDTNGRKRDCSSPGEKRVSMMIEVYLPRKFWNTRENIICVPGSSTPICKIEALKILLLQLLIRRMDLSLNQKPLF